MGSLRSAPATRVQSRLYTSSRPEISAARRRATLGPAAAQGTKHHKNGIYTEAVTKHDEGIWYLRSTVQDGDGTCEVAGAGSGLCPLWGPYWIYRPRGWLDVVLGQTCARHLVAWAGLPPRGAKSCLVRGAVTVCRRYELKTAPCAVGTVRKYVSRRIRGHELQISSARPQARVPPIFDCAEPTDACCKGTVRFL